MKVYLTGAFEYRDFRFGFGNAAYHAYRSLKDLGINVICKDPDDESPVEADIEICFTQPDKYKFYSNGYKIGYTPWESTGFISSWWPKFSECHEIWTTSTFNKELFKNNLGEKPIHVYTHGIDHNYKPKKRKRDPDKPFTFLFIGEPYARKDGHLVTRTFIDLYGNNPDYRLIIKCTVENTIKVYDASGRVFGSPGSLYDNIIVITDMYDAQEMIQLYDMADVFVYPSWGEGFGFNPLQAMAMGIPTITTYKWSEYAKYITVPIESDWAPSPWPEIHPGSMLKPDDKHFKEAMRVAPVKFDDWSERAFKNSFKIHEDFDWMAVTKPTALHLKKIYRSLTSRNLAC